MSRTLTLPQLHAATNGHPALYYALGQHMRRTGTTYTEALDHARRHRWLPANLTPPPELAKLLNAGTATQLTLLD